MVKTVVGGWIDRIDPGSVVKNIQGDDGTPSEYIQDGIRLALALIEETSRGPNLCGILGNNDGRRFCR